MFTQSVMILLAVIAVFSVTACGLQIADVEPTCNNTAQYNFACRCDPVCVQYGDCCRDAPYFIPMKQKVGMSQFTCVTLDNDQILMKMSCPADWKDKKTRFHCEHPDDSFQDPILNVPITSHRTNITYRNRYCAYCHQDLYIGTSTVWPIFFNCTNWLNLDEEDLLNHLVYNTGTSSWVLNITDYLSFFSDTKSNNSDYFETCHVGVQAPKEVRSFLRPCPRKLVDFCPPNWTDSEVRTQCEFYVSYVCSPDDNQMYQNVHCGYCNNNGTFKSVVCVGDPVLRTRPLADFSLIFDWNKFSASSICKGETEEYDPLSRTCRMLFNEMEMSEELVEISSMVNIPASTPDGPKNDTKKDNKTLDTIFLTCPKFRLDSDEYVKDNETGTVFVPVYNRTYKPDEFRIESDGRLTICATFEVKPDREVYSWGLFYVTIIGISLSILFLVLHLVMFFLTPKQRNLSSMNLASLSLSLLLTYCAFLVGWKLEGTVIPCIVAAVIMHYSLLAAFCWMFTIAYDISRVLRESASKLIVTSGKHWKRFLLYSALSWLIPAVIAATALVAQYSDVHFNGLHPDFGREFCWFNNAEALLLFCVTPTCVVMLLNVVFFCWSAYIIFSTTLNIRSSSNSQQDFWLYVRLALIMGLTWITGLVGSYINVEGMWYLFTFLNTLQGLFIFLAFSCNMKVWNEVFHSSRSLPTSHQSHQIKLQTPLHTSSS